MRVTIGRRQQLAMSTTSPFVTRSPTSERTRKKLQAPVCESEPTGVLNCRHLVSKISGDAGL